MRGASFLSLLVGCSLAAASPAVAWDWNWWRSRPAEAALAPSNVRGTVATTAGSGCGPAGTGEAPAVKASDLESAGKVHFESCGA